MFSPDFTQYQTLIFDCDGVILNSNAIKTQAFYEVAKTYGHRPAQALRNYHTQNGGISRYQKFEYLFTHILQQPIETHALNTLLAHFSNTVKKALLTCEMAQNISALRHQTSHTKWLIISGGDQHELRNIFKQRGLAKYFDGGIFGSPDDKHSILKHQIKRGNIVGKSLFLGDSVYDAQAAKAAQMDFIFLSKWSEVSDWEARFGRNAYLDLSALLSSKSTRHDDQSTLNLQ